jgi:hypothetical protein
MRFYPIQFALLRLQELHRKAVGKSDKFSTKVASRLSRNSAKLAYGNSFYIALGQLITVGPRTQLEIFKEICGFVSKRTSLDGLEGLFLTGLQAARTHRAIAGATNVGATGVELWGQLGPPQLLGGGAGVMPIYDVGSKMLAFASWSALNEMTKKAADKGTAADGLATFPLDWLFQGNAWQSGSLDPGDGFDLGTSLPGIGFPLGRQPGLSRGQIRRPTDAAEGEDADRATGWGMAGAALGGIVGGFVAGPGGALEGIQAGGVIGGGAAGFLGYMWNDIKDAFDEESNDEVPGSDVDGGQPPENPDSGTQPGGVEGGDHPAT